MPNARACALKKWFDTNYHYVVPEWDRTPSLAVNLPLLVYRRARRVLGDSAKPVVLGPFTFVKLSRNVPDTPRALQELAPLYARLLLELEAAGATWVQVDEPWLVRDVTEEEMECLAAVYHRISGGPSRLQIMLQTYFACHHHFLLSMARTTLTAKPDQSHSYAVTSLLSPTDQ